MFPCAEEMGRAHMAFASRGVIMRVEQLLVKRRTMGDKVGQARPGRASEGLVLTQVLSILLCHPYYCQHKACFRIFGTTGDLVRIRQNSIASGVQLFLLPT